MDSLRVRLIIEGRVQGVWFRDSARRQATGLGVTGWVRNRPEGSVEVLAEGPQEGINALIAWCHTGPTAARVDRVRKEYEPWAGEFPSFEIVY
jgi:acylphosphatase